MSGDVRPSERSAAPVVERKSQASPSTSSIHSDTSQFAVRAATSTSALTKPKIVSNSHYQRSTDHGNFQPAHRAAESRNLNGYSKLPDFRRLTSNTEPTTINGHKDVLHNRKDNGHQSNRGAYQPNTLTKFGRINDKAGQALPQNLEPRRDFRDVPIPQNFRTDMNRNKSSGGLHGPPSASMIGDSSNFKPTFISSASAFKISAKQDAFRNMQSEHIRKGVPISVPTNPPYQRPRPFLTPTSNNLSSVSGQSEDIEVLNSLGSLRISDALSAKDQEEALKDLISSTSDLTGIEIDIDAHPVGMNDGIHLRPHQIQGLAWLRDREKGKKRGGILGDDMGLGKTVQMIALILANPAQQKPRTTLIVCPPSLMGQWKDEIDDKTDGRLKVLVHHGPKRTTDSRKLMKYDVVITSYNTAVSDWMPDDKANKKVTDSNARDDIRVSEDVDDDEVEIVPRRVDANEESSRDLIKIPSALYGSAFYRIILDEAHVIKERTTKVHKACCGLVGHYLWCLTGTPIQNTVYDLYALFEFLGKIVSPLHSYSEFKVKIGDPLKNKRAKIAMARLSVVLKAVMLRRTKTMMVEGKPIVILPKREIIEVKGPFLDDEERAFYEAVEKKMTLVMNAYLKAGTAMSNYTSVLILLLRMRQACSHPSLITKNNGNIDEELLESNISPAFTSQGPQEENGLSDLIGGLAGLSVAKKTAELPTCSVCHKPVKVVGSGNYCPACQSDFAIYGSLQFSTKIRKALRILNEIRKENPKRKTIVFSQFTSMFSILEPFLAQGGFNFVRFDGKLNAQQKETALRRIRNDPVVTIILISIKCGSVGLNLTACSRVILMDLWWNPAIENQAFDRAHRFGQTEDVKIYKITVDQTIEDRILTLQGQKAELARAALDGGDITKGNKLSFQDILYLFRGDGSST